MIKRKTSVILLCLYALMVELSAAELILQVTDEEGRPIPSVEAEMLLLNYGGTRRHSLQPTGSTVTVVLTPDELKRWWPERPIPNAVEGHILLRASGYAPLKSKPFKLFGEETDLSIPRTVSFPRHAAVALGIDDVITVDVVLRWPEERLVRLMTTDGTPVAGAKVEINMLWSTSNHCTVANGIDLLKVAESNDDGLIEVPDGDFEYLFRFPTGLHAHIRGNTDLDDARDRLITRLTNRVTPIRVEYWKNRKFRLTFHLDGKPMVGKEITAFSRTCGCGACRIQLAVTDEGGKAHQTGIFANEDERYYAESFAAIGLDKVWRFDPLLIPFEREAVVQLRSNPLGLEGLWSEIERFSLPERRSPKGHSTAVSADLRDSRSARYNQPGIPRLLERWQTVWKNREHVSTDLPSLADPNQDTVVIATVDGIQSFYSLDGSAIYSEYRLKVERVIDGTMTRPLVQGVLTGTRAGGSLDINDRRWATYTVTGRGFPRLNERYIFFLEWNPETEDYTIHRAYWSKLDTIVPVDPHPEMPYAGMNEAEFLMMILQARQSDG